MGMHDTLLRDHNVLSTNELDEARAAVAEKYCDHRLSLVSGASVDVIHRHVRGAHVSLNVLRYGAKVAINPGELKDFYLLQLPLLGSAEIRHRGETVSANHLSGTLLNPDRPTEMVWGRDCCKLMLQIDAGFLQRVAQEEIGGVLPGAIRFDPKVDLTGKRGKRIRKLALTAARAIDTGDLKATTQDLNLLSMERHLALTLLESQNSNVSHLLEACEVGASVHVRRAIEYIRAFHHESLDLSDIALAAGIHHRSLQTNFRKTLGVTPIQFLRDVRLDAARFHLLQRHNRPKVSEIAYDCGYTHLGRFSRDFRARFGHAPSATNQ